MISIHKKYSYLLLIRCIQIGMIIKKQYLFYHTMFKSLVLFLYVKLSFKSSKWSLHHETRVHVSAVLYFAVTDEVQIQVEKRLFCI